MLVRQAPAARFRSITDRTNTIRSTLIFLAGLAIGAAGCAQAADQTDVDAAIVIAVDISYSMDSDEQHLQRNGYIDAFNSSEVLKAIAAGEKHRIAVTYVQWAGANDQEVIVPWHVIEDAATAHAFTDELAGKPYRRAARTSIAGGLLFSMPLFDLLGMKATRRVIDVSGDGPNNQGIPVTEARAKVLDRGIVINGLPIIWRRASLGMMDIDNLDAYYETCVIGGENSFMIPIRTVENIGVATRLKLLQEIADRGQTPRVRLVADTPVDCMIGEKLWQQRFGSFRN